MTIQDMPYLFCYLKCESFGLVSHLIQQEKVRKHGTFNPAVAGHSLGKSFENRCLNDDYKIYFNIQCATGGAGRCVPVSMKL